MEDKVKLLSKVSAGAAIGAGMLAASTVGASAAIDCSVCWHTHETYVYPPGARVVIHDDNWRWSRRDRYVFREHEGRGYGRGDSLREWQIQHTSDGSTLRGRRSAVCLFDKRGPGGATHRGQGSPISGESR